MKRIQAIVVNWNAGRRLADCVASLLEADESSLTVTVVDNDSSDGSLDFLDSNEQVRVLKTGSNLGFGRAVNQGAAGTETPFLLAMNPDVTLRSEAVRRMADFLEQNPQAGIVGPRLLGEDGNVLWTCGERPRLGTEICRKFLLHIVLPFLKFGRQRPDRTAPVDWVTGACFMVRASAFESVGGMDEAIFMYYEDVDLCLRLKAVGWGVYYVPQAEGAHEGGASSQQVLSRMIRASSKSYRYFVRKHFGRLAGLSLELLAPVELSLRLGLWSALWLLHSRRREEAVERLRAYRDLWKSSVEDGFGKERRV